MIYQMVKKRVAKKRIAKRKVAKKIKQTESTKPDVSKMTRLEYEQSMMDPRFRAAMIGFNHPMPQANNALREVETKNNELTRQMTLEQELFNQKEKYIKLKARKNEQAQQHAEEIANLKLEEQNRELERCVEREQEKNIREKELMNHQSAYNQMMFQMNNQLSAQKQITEQQKRRHQEEMEKSKVQHELDLAQKEKEHQAQILPKEEQINEIKRELENKETEFKHKEELLNKELQLKKSELEKKSQPVMYDLDSQTNENNRQIDIAGLIHESEERQKDATKNLMISEFKRLEQQIVNPINEQNQAIQRKIDETKAQSESIQNILNANHQNVMLKLEQQQQQDLTPILDSNEQIKQQIELNNAENKKTRELINAKHEQVMLKMEKNAQDANNQLKLENAEMKNYIRENQEVINQQIKQRDLETEKKILEQQVNQNVKKKYDKQVQQSVLRTHQLELQTDEARKALEAKQKEDEARQQLIIEAMKIDSTITPDDINNSEQFTHKMNQKRVEYQKNLEVLKRQKQLNDEVMSENQSLYNLRAREEESLSLYFVEHPKVNQYAEEVLGYKTMEQKFANLPTIVDSWNERVANNVLLYKNLRDSKNPEIMNQAEVEMNSFRSAYKYITEEEPEAAIERDKRHRQELQNSIEQATTDLQRVIAEKEEIQQRLNQANQYQTQLQWFYNNADDSFRQSFDETFGPPQETNQESN